MDETALRAAAGAFGAPAGPLRPVRAGPAPLFDVSYADGRRVALRLHGPAADARTVTDGLRLAEALADAGLATPWPQRTGDGALTASVADMCASALQWVPAAPFAGVPDPARLRAVGALLADFHVTADAVAPAGLHLPDRRPTTPPPARGDPMPAATAAARAARAAWADEPVGPVLDDPGAVLHGSGAVWLIGVDRAGTGWRVQDLAAALWPHADAPDLPTLRAAVVAGYVGAGGKDRDADPHRIALCLLLRAMRTAALAPEDDRAHARIRTLAALLET
jgi:Ser/Thr protein kinase RdoA (MazF antagonist)